jgi:hypothetical protein
MLLYLDAFSGEEIVSDSYDIKLVFDGVGGEVEPKYIMKGGESYDVGCGNEFGGAGEDEGAAD